MNDAPENELFSAYLDGELTAAEQADVEQLLAASPAARQLLDDLRALSTNLQALPQHKLGEDLSEQVIRLAERKILTRAEQLTKPSPQRPSLLIRLVESRALVWSGLAVAVAVMLMIMGPKDDPPADNGRLALTLDETTPDSSDEDEAGIGPGPIIESGESASGVDEEGKRGGGGPRGGKDGRDARVDGALVDDTTDEAIQKAKLYEGGGVLENGTGSDLGIVARKPVAAGRPSRGSGRVAPGTVDDGGAGHPATLPRTALATNAPRGSIPEGFADEAGTMVVYCDISLEAAQDGVFAGLLTTNGIALTDVNGRVNMDTAVGDAILSQTAKDQTVDEHGHAQKKLNGKAATPQRETHARDLKQVYAVAASREQIVGMLSALSASEDTVLALSVAPAPDTPEQKNLRRYDRFTARRRPGRADTQSPGLAGTQSAAQLAEEQDATQFGGGAKTAPDELPSKTAEQQRLGDNFKYKGEIAGQAWQIDMANAPSGVERLLRRSDASRGRAVAAAQRGVRLQPGQPQAGSAYGGVQTPHVGKGALGRAGGEPVTRPAREPNAEPAGEVTQKQERFKDVPKGPAADPAPADDAAPVQPVAPDSPGDRPHGVSGYAPPSPAPGAAQPRPNAEPAVQAPKVDPLTPVVPAEPPTVPPPAPGPTEQEKVADSPPTEADPDLRPAATATDLPDNLPDDAKKEEAADPKAFAAKSPDAEGPGQGQPKAPRVAGQQLQATNGGIGPVAGDDLNSTRPDPTGGWQQAEPPETAQTVRTAESTQTPQPKSGKGDGAFGTESRNKLEFPRQQVAQQDVANYRTLFVVRIVDTTGRYSSRVNMSVEAASEPAAAAESSIEARPTVEAEPAAEAKQ
ncbi:MAG: zf-HC2 domain-containing protein [Candidatus Nealsonbacteria bacterium]|nr:zf-HC2 domain-containing protein [Candidatus Nealsonbacteria bacterium]